MDIEEMIKYAQDIEAKATAEQAEDLRQRRADSVDRMHESLIALFGDIPAMLDMIVLIPEGHNEADEATFTFRNRPYSLSNRGGDWSIVRMDERGEDDPRCRPSYYMHPIYRNDHLGSNQHSLLIALAKLDTEPEAEPISARVTVEPILPIPTPAEVMADAIREYIEDCMSRYRPDEY